MVPSLVAVGFGHCDASERPEAELSELHALQGEWQSDNGDREKCGAEQPAERESEATQDEPEDVPDRLHRRRPRLAPAGSESSLVT